MSDYSYTPPVPRLTLLFALLGLAWCVYISFPANTSIPCATSGCELFRDSTIGGVSLWWVGAAFFFVLSAICLRGRSFLAAKFLALAIFLDAILLIIMFFTAPCLDCLVVAACMGLCLLCLQLPHSEFIPPKKGHPLLLAIWFGLFLANAVLAANESIPAYTVGDAETTEVRLYFSPSCPACREAVASLAGKATLYPVEENPGDFEAVLRFEVLLQGNKLTYEEALNKSLDPRTPVPQIALPRQLELRAQMLRNKAAVFGQGFRALPLIVINGMPGFEQAEKNKPVRQKPAAEVDGPLAPETDEQLAPETENLRTPDATTGKDSIKDISDFLNNTGNLGQCSQRSAIPCK